MMLIGLHGVAKARKLYTIMTLYKHRLGWPGSSTESRDLILFFSESVANNDYLRNWRMRSGKSGRPGSSTDSHLPLQHRHALLSSTPAGWCRWVGGGYDQADVKLHCLHFCDVCLVCVIRCLFDMCKIAMVASVVFFFFRFFKCVP